MATTHDTGYAADAVASRSTTHAFDRTLDQLSEANYDANASTLNRDNACSAECRLPNPPFVFPASPPLAGPPIARPRRRPMSMADIQSRPLSTSSTADLGRGNQPAALPQFSFNPGASIPTDIDSMAILSPPITPNSARPMPSPSQPAGHGHRRGGSEFVGGSIRDGNSIAVMSTSPTKSESGFASPGLQPLPTRRGHRRGVSGAISTNDLPFLCPQPDFMLHKGSSAPNSPTTFNPHQGTLLPLDDQPFPLPEPLANPVPIQALKDTEENTIINHSIPIPTSPPRMEPSPRQSKAGRARVGFSDTLEFIPRPLSLVSNDTSSTVTARPSHSVSGSISSIVSAASPGGSDSPARLTRSPTRETVESRPSTAGAILQRTGTDLKFVVAAGNTSPRRRNSIPTLLDMSTSHSATTANPSPVKTPKRWSFFGLDPFIGSMPASKHRSCSSSSSESVNKPATASSSSDHETDSSDDDDAAVYDSNDAKKFRQKTSRKKRVKGWAGVILPLRSNKKRSKILAIRPPTPPASVGPVENDEDETDVNQAAPDTQIPPTTPTVLVTGSQSTEDSGTPKRRRPDEEGSFPMIDLDAALGPFNTPLPHNPEWDAAQRAAGNAGKRRLHSAQGMKGFSGPGMHYHRRAESAPDLPPFDPGCAGIHQFGSSSTMADVFEEDEEEDGETSSEQLDSESDELEGEETNHSDGEATPHATTKLAAAELPNELVASDTSIKAALSRRPSYGSTDSDDASAVHAVRPECSKTSLHEEVIAEESPPIIFRNASVFGCLSADENNSAPSSSSLAPGRRDTSSVEVNQSIPLINGMAVPLSPYSTSHASSYPSPRSLMSIDAQRLSTAPSSVTDENTFHSLLMGEPGPEVRISVDYDIPSLTSCTSTMTRESAFIPTARMSQPSLREQRPVSVSSAAFGRRRSSLVSLGRLISSSHGERSKLSMEVTLDNGSEAKRSWSKNSKTKRLGRMMQFWKPSKDTDPS